MRRTFPALSAVLLLGFFVHPLRSQQVPATSVTGVVQQLGNPDPVPGAVVTLCSETGKRIVSVSNGTDKMPPRDQIQEIRIGRSDGISPSRITITSSVAECIDSRDTTTDLTGRFEFKNVGFGQFKIQIRKEGYELRRGADVLTESIAVDAQHATPHLTLYLIRSATIIGTVHDTNGKPLASVAVLVAVPNGDGFRTLASRMTNDRGEYRLFGFPPGEVMVVVDRGSGRPIFYPGVTDMSQAQRVRVPQGEEIALRDIVVKPLGFPAKLYPPAQRIAKLSGSYHDASHHASLPDVVLETPDVRRKENETRQWRQPLGRRDLDEHARHARYGYLMLRKGRWGDNQILSESWVKQATTRGRGPVDYGYSWWLNTDGMTWPEVSKTSYGAQAPATTRSGSIPSMTLLLSGDGTRKTRMSFSNGSSCRSDPEAYWIAFGRGHS
jgi:hypothetical protein